MTIIALKWQFRSMTTITEDLMEGSPGINKNIISNK